MYSTGVVVLTRQPYQVWAVEDLADPRPVQLAPLPLALSSAPGPSCLAVLEPRFTASGALEVRGQVCSAGNEWGLAYGKRGTWLRLGEALWGG